MSGIGPSFVADHDRHGLTYVVQALCLRWEWTDRNVCVTSLNKNAGLSRVESGIEKVFRLSAKLKLADDRCVAIEVFALQVIKKLTTASCHCDQAAA